MNKVIILSESIRIKDFPEREVLYSWSKNELAHLLVGEKSADCLLLDFPDFSGDDALFASSVKLNFPMLDAGIIAPERLENLIINNPLTKSCVYLPSDSSDLDSRIEEFIKKSKDSNKRESQRFCWPLKALFSTGEGEERQTFELDIFSISSGGAYLKSEKLLPRAGEKAWIKVKFKNSEITTQCEVNDYHARSSNYPFGFSIRFTSLSENACKALDRLVDDAIIKILLDPLSEPEIPSLDSDELSIESFTL